MTTLRAAIQYIYGLQNLLDEIQTGTLDLAAYQLTEAELRPPPSNKPSAPQLKTLKKGGRQNGGNSVRKPAQRRKPVQRTPQHAASAPAGGGGGLRSGPVTLAMKASGGLPAPAYRKSEKRPSPSMAAVAPSAPEPAARYVLPLQPRDASHVLRRDYAPAGPPRQPSVGLPLGKAAAAPNASGVTSSLSPNLLSLRPLPVSALFPGSAMQQQPPLPSLQTLRHPRTTAGGGEGEKAMLNAEEVLNSSSSSGSTAFYCTTAGMYKHRQCSLLNLS